MAKLPADRYSTAHALADDLELWLRGEPIKARRIGTIGLAYRWTRRRARPIAAATAATLLVLVLLGWLGRQSQVNTLRNRIEQSIQDPVVAWEQRAEVESQLLTLESLDSQAASALRDRMLATVRQRIQDELTTPRLSSEVSLRIDKQLQWLATRGAQVESDLVRTFESRRSRWSPLVSFQAPFNSLDGLPAEAATSALATEAGIVATSNSPVPLARFDKDLGDIEAVLRYGSQPEESQTYNLVFNWNDKQTLRFVMQEANNRCRLSIFQGDERLRTEDFPLDSVRGRVLRVTIQGGAYEFDVGQNKKVRFYPLTMATRRNLTISASWPKRVPLISLTLNRAESPPVLSSLQAGDDLYLKGDWEGARAMYDASATSAVASGNRLEAIFKRGQCSFQLELWQEAAIDLEQVAIGEESVFQASALCHCWYALRQLKDFERAAAMHDRLASSFSPATISETLSDTQIRKLVNTISTQHTGLGSMFPSQDQVTDLERTVAIQRVVDPSFRTIPYENRFTLLRSYHALGQYKEAIQLGREIASEHRGLQQAVTETAWLLRLGGEAEAALKLIEDDLVRRATYDEDPGEVQLERARVLFALGRLKEAEQVIDDYEATHDDKVRFRSFGAAKLMKGVLRRLDGDEVAAQQAWNAGRWTPQRGELNTGVEIVYAIAIEAVASEGNETSLETIVGASLNRMAGGEQNMANVLANNRQIICSAIRPAFDSQRGREVLVDVAFLRKPFRTWVMQPMQVVFHQAILRTCPQEYSDEDYPVAEACLSALMGDLSGKDSAQIALVTGSIAAAWKGVAPDVALFMVGKKSSPALAYILAARYRSRGWKDGQRMWDIAASAPADSPVKARVDSRATAPANP